VTGNDAALRRLRDRASLGQVAIATASVAIAGGIAPWSLAIACALATWAMLRPLPEATSRTAERQWTVLVAIALVGTLVRAVTTADLLDAGLDFLLLLVVQRLFNRQRAREHMQLLLLGALLMVAGAVINADLNYPVLFAAYLVVSAMTLMLNHLCAEGERLGARTAATLAKEGVRSRRLLWRAAAQVAGIAAIGAVVTFVAFPRWGVGAFLRGGIARDSKSGFSSTVELGDFGRIKSDATVVMRIEPDTPGDWGERTDWHLRGSSFDAYANGRWFHDQDVEATLVATGGGYQTLRDVRGGAQIKAGRGLPTIVPVPGFAASTQMLHATVTLEDIGVDVVFAASEPLAVRLSPRGMIEGTARLRGGRSDELRIDKAPGPVRYQFVSRIGRPTEAELEAVGDPAVPNAYVHYSTVIPGLGAQVGDLARTLVRDEATRHRKVLAIMRHLASFRYTVDLAAPSPEWADADPVEAFLFDLQAGHCEYFASAAVILLRQVGIPARLVNGYYGPQLNTVGGYYSVRQADAHSWIEVHFGDLGWVTFDPTPPSFRVAGDDAGLWPGAAEWLDAVRNAYLDWIIDYDLGKQLSLFDNLRLRDQQATTALGRWRWLLYAIGGAGILGFVVSRLRRRGRPRKRPETAIWERVVGKLARRGHALDPAESARRYADRVAAAEPALAPALLAFAKAYDDARFGQGATHSGRDTAAVGALRTAAMSLLAAIASQGRRRAP
jgi:transglutaminase-like putative cysteine protease